LKKYFSVSKKSNIRNTPNNRVPNKSLHVKRIGGVPTKFTLVSTESVFRDVQYIELQERCLHQNERNRDKKMFEENDDVVEKTPLIKRGSSSTMPKILSGGTGI
jgi:hypothetical protein